MSSTTQDRATAYATAVVAGDIIASRLVRQACQRHLDDLARQELSGLVWKVEESEDAIDFFSDILCLPEETVSDDDADAEEEVPMSASAFVLSPWQEFIVGSLMGWWTVKGYRRFRTAYIETAKGSGKTPLCAGLLLYLLVSDGERGGQYFVAAVTREQAQIAFADCEKMVTASPYLRDLIVRRVNNLAMPSTQSFIRAISSEKRGLDGKRVSGAVLDELHEHPTPVVVSKIRKGTKGRQNALILEPTNSGFDRLSVCWAHHEYSRKVLDGALQADDWFAFVCGLDPCQACLDAGKWFPDEDCPNCDSWQIEGPHWEKANPNLGISVPTQYVRDLVRQAQGMPSEVSDVLRFIFCVWTQGHTMFLNMPKWHACEGHVKSSELIGARWFAGLDLGQSDDMTALVLIACLDDGRVWVVPKFWMPSAAIARFPNRPYPEWRRSGALTIIPDSEVIDYGVVERHVLDICQGYGVIEVAYDKRFAEQMAQNLTAAGVTMVNTPQGFQLTEALRKLSDLVNTGQLVHDGNVVLTAQAANLIVKHGRNKEMRPDKDKAVDKIDGMVALVMALNSVVLQPQYSEPQIFFVGGGGGAIR